MKLFFLIIFFWIFNLFANNAYIQENGYTYTANDIHENNRNKTIIEKINDDGVTRILEIRPSVHNKRLLSDNKDIYLAYFKSGENMISKINKNVSGLNEYITLYPPRGYSAWYGTTYNVENGKIIANGIEDDDDIYPNKPKTIYYDFVYDNNNDTWIPKNKQGYLVYEDARSAIKHWFYDGKLTRWYPKIDYNKIDKDIWFEQTPTTELRNYPMKLWSKEDKGEEINYPEEYKKKFSEERERLRLEEEKRIAEEKQKLQQKIFIILGILFLVIFGGFFIKRLKKKKMKRRMKLSQIQ